MFKSIECWVCGADMYYIRDKEVEEWKANNIRGYIKREEI